MAYSVKDFVREVKAIAATNPTYRTGGIGKDGTCDCVGLIIGAMYALGREKYDLKSSNYFARYQMEYLTPIDGSTPLRLGEIVYKRREDTGGLNDRYKPGGRYYTGDLYDYYHVGVVTAESPLGITHCTEANGHSGIVVDTAIGNWGLAGRLTGVAYGADSGDETAADDAFGIIGSETGDDLEGGLMAEPEENAVQYAVVTSPNGKPVKLRKSASTREPVYWHVSHGTRVQVERERGSWSLIRAMCTDGHMRRAYMMIEFLERE